MCLTNIDEKLARKWGIGYKQVKKLEDGTYVCFDFYPNRGKVAYPLNQWITDPNDGDIQGFRAPKYRTGFHILLDRRAPVFYTNTPLYPAIKVRFRKVVATNFNEPDSYYGRQVVAREIMNLGEVS